MKALLLAAGLGTRLKPLTDGIPKCLVPINGKPLLEYWLELLVNTGVNSILINLHYMSEKVESYILSSPYSQYVTMVHEKKLFGTGGTLLANRSFFKNDKILLIHADNLSVFNLNDFIKAHEARPEQCLITMMTFETDTPENCGIVELDQKRVVTRFYEKIKNPPGNLANGAVFILENSVIEFMLELEQDGIDFCVDVLPFFMGKIFTFHNNQYHRDIGTFESYQSAVRDFTQ